MRQRGSLRDGGERYLRQPDTQDDGRDDRQNDPQMMGDAGPGPGRQDRQCHPRHAGKNAAPSRLRITHPMQRQNEQRGRHQVNQLNEDVHDLPPSRVLNILSIRSVIKKPLMMLVMEANKAMAPSTRMPVG